jgi:hypothetical protein
MPNLIGICFRTKKENKMTRYLGLAIILAIFGGAVIMGGGEDSSIDLLSLIFVIGIGVGHALGSKNDENTITRFGNGCVRGGWLGLLLGLTLISGSEVAAQMDLSMIMPEVAVCLLSPLYGYFFKIITMQLD